MQSISAITMTRLLRDNPAKPDERSAKVVALAEDNPYAFQYHYYNNTQPENVEFMEEIRALMDKYPGVVTLGEISSEDSLLDDGSNTPKATNACIWRIVLNC